MTSHHADVPGARAAEATRWRIDPTRSEVAFRVKSVGLLTVKGRFTRYHGTLDLGAQPAVELTIEADSVDTGNARRDEHLRSPDFFDAAAHPYVRFVSESALLDGERLVVRGRLHARGSSMPLAVEATLRRSGDELEVRAATVADRRDVAMRWNRLGMVGNACELLVEGRLVRDGG